MDSRVAVPEYLEDSIENALDRIWELQAGTRVQSDEYFSQLFMRDHTTFESFTAFCDRSPWPVDDASDLQHVSRDELDEYVAATTEFETWEGMKTQAAEEAIIEQVIS